MMSNYAITQRQAVERSLWGGAKRQSERR